MAKMLIDVEDLMIWAASELSRKRRGEVPLGRFALAAVDGELVGKWMAPMGYPPMSPMFAAGLGSQGFSRGAPPHDDALVVERALAELRPADLTPRVRLDDLGRGFGFALDAGAALANVRNLVTVHGRLGSRPSLRLEPLEIGARQGANGKPGVWRRETIAEEAFGGRDARREVETPAPARRKGLYPAGAYRGLVYEPDPQTIVNERAEYAAWLAGLFRLADLLSDRMKTRAALPRRAEAVGRRH